MPGYSAIQPHDVVHDHQSSAGGMTRTVTGEFSAEMTAEPRTLLRLGVEDDAQSIEVGADFSAGVDVVFAMPR